MKQIWFFLFITILHQVFSEKPNSGKDATRYENRLYGFSISKPKSWSSANATELAQVFQMTNETMHANIDKFAHIVSNWSVEHITPLFGFSKYPMHTENGQLNPNILSQVVNLHVFKNAKSACDYYNVNTEILQSLSLKMNFVGKCQEVKINGVNFNTQTVHTKFPGVPLIKQIFYAKIVEENRLLLFTLTFVHRQDQAQLKKIINSLQFSNTDA